MKASNYVCKKLHLCFFAGFWMRLWSFTDSQFIYHLNSNYRPNHHFCNSCIYEATTKVLSLNTLFYQFIRRAKDYSKTIFLELFSLIIYHLERGFFGKYEIFIVEAFKLLIFCCLSEITLSLTFDVILAELCPIFWKLFYIYYILYVYWNLFPK